MRRFLEILRDQFTSVLYNLVDLFYNPVGKLRLRELRLQGPVHLPADQLQDEEPFQLPAILIRQVKHTCDVVVFGQLTRKRNNEAPFFSSTTLHQANAYDIAFLGGVAFFESPT